MARAIAVVEDDESIREMLRYYFQSVGYAVRAYESGEALFAGEEGQSLPALYILDIMLPGMDGLEILRRLREGRDTADVPVIMLTARTAEMDRVAGLENGADDYVVKPFGIMELQARVKAVLRRTERRSDRLLTWGDLEIDPAAREVRKAGRVVELTYKEFELLKLLCTRRGVALTRGGGPHPGRDPPGRLGLRLHRRDPHRGHARQGPASEAGGGRDHHGSGRGVQDDVKSRGPQAPWIRACVPAKRRRLGSIPLVSRPAARVGVFLGKMNSPKNIYDFLLPAGPADSARRRNLPPAGGKVARRSRDG